MYENRTNAMTQSTLAKPDTSWRRKRSPDTTMSSQNHNMNMNMVKASAMKLPNVNPPSNSIVLIPYPNRVSAILDQCGRKAQRRFVRFTRIPASDLHQARGGESFSTGARNGSHPPRVISTLSG